MKIASLLAGLSIALASSVYAVPVYEPFADATAFGGTAYSSGSKLGFDASLSGGQTNAQGLWWAETTTTNVNSSITNVSGSLNFSDVPGYSGTLPASAGNS